MRWFTGTMLVVALTVVIARAKPEGGAVVAQAPAFAALDSFVRRYAAADSFSGVIQISKRGTLVFQRRYGDADKNSGSPVQFDTRFNLASVTKIFTGVAVLQLVQARRLSLDDTVGRYLSGFPDRGPGRVTIRQLLTHTGGTGDYWKPEYLNANRARYRRIDDFMALVRNDSLRFDPGSKWSYSNAGYLILGAVIERVTGKSYFDYIREAVLAPAGMRSTDFFALDDVVPGMAVGYTKSNVYNPTRTGWTPNTFLTTTVGSPAGGLYSTADDMQAFAQHLLANKLLSPAWTDSLLHPMVPYGPSKKYGFGVAEEIINGQRVLFHDGGAGGISTELDMMPGLGYVVVVLSNYSPPAGTRVARYAVGLLTGRE